MLHRVKAIPFVLFCLSLASQSDCVKKRERMKSPLARALFGVSVSMAAACVGLFAAVQQMAAEGFSITNEYAIYAVGADGRNERFVDRRTGVNYAVSNAPCARIKRGGKE